MEKDGLFLWVKTLAPSAPRTPKTTVNPDHVRFDWTMELVDPTALRESLYQMFRSDRAPVSLYAASLLRDSATQTRKKLFVFDMDSTFINQEVIDEIGRELGLYEQFAEITESAMQGKIDFVQAFHDRIGLLNGMPSARAHSIVERLTLSPGVESIVGYAKQTGAQTMIVSGGFDFVLEHFQKRLGIDVVHAHHLLQDPHGNLNGQVQLPIIDGERKKIIVQDFKQQHGIRADEVVVIGDGANDIKMMSEATTQVSFKGKDKLNAVANVWILDRNYRWLHALLPEMGSAKFSHMDENKSSPAGLEYDYRRNVALDLILTVVMCGLWNLVVQWHHIETLNALLKTEKYSFWKIWIFTLLTCGIYFIYFEYMKARDFQEISGRTDDSDPILAVILSIFGLNFVYDAILQTKINEYLDRFPG